MNRRCSTKSVMILLIAALFGLWSSSAISVPNEAAPAVAAAGPDAAAGTYSAVMQLGGGLTFMAVFTLHADGTAVSYDLTDFASATLAGPDGPHLNSLAVGSWKHTTGRSYVATLIFFRSAVGGGGEVDSVGRLTIEGSFDERFQTGTAEVIVDAFPCLPATLGCPDPALLPPPTAPVFGTFTALRIVP